MGDDLGAGARGVHAAAADVLRFWLVETPDDKRFGKDPAFDRIIGDRFGGLRDAVLASDAAGWRDDPRNVLAAIILLDQFSRNLHRGSPEAFGGDALARSLAAEAVDRGWDTDMTADERVFLYMPFMHGEDGASQQRSLALFTALGEEKNLHYARAHGEVIARFGRFPGRNAALGRTSTAAEEAYLSQPGVDW